MKIFYCVSVLLPYTFWFIAILFPGYNKPNPEYRINKGITEKRNLLIEDNYNNLVISISYEAPYNECVSRIKKPQ